MRRFTVFSILLLFFSVTVFATATHTLPTVGSSTNTWGTELNSYLNATKSFINVKEYGAAGDGVSDDGPEVAAAIAALTAGDVLYFPSGTYLLTTFTVQTIEASVSFVGDGYENTTITGPGITTNFISIGEDGNLLMKDIGFSTFAEVVNGGIYDTDYISIIRCKADTVKKLYDDAAFILTGDVDYFNVEGCILSNLTEVAIRFRSPVTKYVSITNNDFSDCTGTGCLEIGSNEETLENERCVISGNSFIDIVSDSNQVYCVLVYDANSIITENTFDTISADVGSYSIYTKSLRSNISNNIIVDGCNGTTEYAAIRCKGQERGGALTTPFGYSHVISGNLINYSTAITYLGIKIDISDTQIVNNVIDGALVGVVSLAENNVSASYNTFYNCKSAVQIYATTAHVKNVTINGNTMRDFDYEGAFSAGINLVTALGTIDNVVIANNVMDNIDDDQDLSAGIRVDLTENIEGLTVSGNIFDTMDLGIDIRVAAGVINYASIQNNTFRTMASTIIDAATISGTGSMARNNIGYVTENGGTSSAIASGATITHGCWTTPTIVSVIPTEASATDVYATVDGDNITVIYTGGGTKAFYWEAKVR